MARDLGRYPGDGPRGHRLRDVRRRSPRRWTSTAWCATTTCAAAATSATSASTCCPRSSARSSRTRSRCASGRRSSASPRAHGANVKIVEVPPGPPVLVHARRPRSTARSTRRYADLIAASKRVRGAMEQHGGRRRRRRLRRGRPRAGPLPPRPREGGAHRRHASRRRRRRCRSPSAAAPAGRVHVAERAAAARASTCSLPRDGAQLDGRPAGAAGASRHRGALVPLGEIGTAARRTGRADDLPQEPATRGLRHRRDGGPQPGRGGVRSQPTGATAAPAAAGLQRRLRRRRRVEDHRRRLPRPRPRLRRGAADDLRAAGGADAVARHPAGHHDRDPADAHRHHARLLAAQPAVHRRPVGGYATPVFFTATGDDRHDRAGRHRRAQLDHPDRLHRAHPQPRRHCRSPRR